MGLISDVVESAREAFRFKDTVIYKGNSDLQEQYDALKKLNDEYPDNEDLMSQLYIVKKGLDGENEIEYQLKKSNIGMYVLRDVKAKYEDLTAQIDYVIITAYYTYFVECKNLVGNITVNEKGDFIREFTVYGKKIKKGMYSPLRQVEAQREVVRKIWDSKKSRFDKFIASKYFDHYHKVLVVAANQDTILNTSKAPSDIKYKVLRADSLIRQIEYDIGHRDKDDVPWSKKQMEESAANYLHLSDNVSIDYYEYYKNKYCDGLEEKIYFSDDLRNKLIEFRKQKSTDSNIPAYYVFTDDELEKLLELMPKTVDELKGILIPDKKIECHGEDIIKIINDKK